MVWAHREEPAPPSLTFEELDHWSIELAGNAQATLQVTRAQNIWDRPVARLRYRGDGHSESRPRISVKLPNPVIGPSDADCVDLWVYGNRWDWEKPAGTPPVSIILRLIDAQNEPHDLAIDTVRWQEWWLMHKKLPAAVRPPLKLAGLEISGGWQSEWREIYFDSVRLYKEDLKPLSMKARPRRPLTLTAGQNAGANTGSGRLLFPTREQTILPMHQGGSYRSLAKELAPGRFSFSYKGKDCSLIYLFEAEAGLNSIEAKVGSEPVGQLLNGAGVRLGDGVPSPKLRLARLDAGIVTAQYSDGTQLQLRIWQKSLVVDVQNTSGSATELAFGQLTNLVEPRGIGVPYLTYGGGPRPSILLSRVGGRPVFTSLWLDWYRSNGSELYAAEGLSTNGARINGGVRYHSRTDGRRNPLFERFFLTVSPRFEEVLPVVPNPVGLHAARAVDRLWQESWGPDDYEKQMQRCERLRAYGIQNLIQCNHEIAWRDGGESFTLRTRAAPKKGGDAALVNYVAHQRGLGWLAGLYSNYTDYSPVNEFWNPDCVQRQPDGNWRSAWPRCWAEKPLCAVEFDAQLAPQIERKFHPNSAYTDVHTAVSPWGYNDYDARSPGAGTFVQTFYAYGELLRNDSRVYGEPIFSEGTYQWLYAGLADGNYALAYDGRPLAKEPLLPVFDLYQIHTKECDIGMGWTANFCDAIPDWRKPDNLDRAIDRFLLNTLAYGHIGWLVEEEHGIARTCRSYYMLQQVQTRYGLKVPTRIDYWNGHNFVSVSEALVQDVPRLRRQLTVEYPGGLQLWFNDHPVEHWQVPELNLDLPTAGWAVRTKDGKLFSFSAMAGTNRVDYLRSPAYTYLDGRGQWFETREAASNGALAIRPKAPHQLEVIRISGDGDFVIKRPYEMPRRCVGCSAFDAANHKLAGPQWRDLDSATRVRPVENAIRYIFEF
jgi:hypothetical protein